MRGRQLSIQEQRDELSRVLVLFVYPAHKDIRTKIVDALNRTSDAQHTGKQQFIKMAQRKNAAVLEECREAVRRIGSGIWEEIRQGLEEVRV